MGVGLSGCRTIGSSDYRVVGLSGCRTIGSSDYRAVGILGLNDIIYMSWCEFGDYSTLRNCNKDFTISA